MNQIPNHPWTYAVAHIYTHNIERIDTLIFTNIIYKYIEDTNTHTHTLTHISTYTSIHTEHSRTHTHTCTNTYKHTHTHTCTFKPNCVQFVRCLHGPSSAWIVYTGWWNTSEGLMDSQCSGPEQWCVDGERRTHTQRERESRVKSGFHQLFFPPSQAAMRCCHYHVLRACK